MGTIYIDDKAVEFEPGQNVLDAARKAGIDTPYFCYHPALGAAGSCRICAMETVPQKEGEKPRTVMTCSIPAQDGQQFRFKSPKAKQIQKAVVEFYMTNHPNDCPVMKAVTVTFKTQPSVSAMLTAAMMDKNVPCRINFRSVGIPNHEPLCDLLSLRTLIKTMRLVMILCNGVKQSRVSSYRRWCIR